MIRFILLHNIFWYRSFLRWNFNRKLRNIALFIETHNIYPVSLDKELLKIWKSNG